MGISTIGLPKKITELQSYLKANKVFLFTFCISILIFSVWLVAFYPANLSFDSINQLGQVSSGVLNDAHPFFSTLILALFTKYLGGVSALALFQIFVSSLIAALFAQYFLRKNVNKWVILASLLLFWLSPAVGIYNVTIWKDVLFSQTIVLLGYAYLQVVDNPASRKLLFVVLGLTLLVSLLRHNGVIYLIFIPALLFWVKRVKLRTAIYQIISLILLFVLVTGPLAAFLGVGKNNFIGANTALRLQLVAAIMSSNDRDMDAAELSYYSSIVPRDSYVTSYRCSSIDGFSVANKPMVDSYFLGRLERQQQFAQSTNRLFLKNLPIIAADRTCLFSYQMGLGLKNWYDPYYLGIFPNTLGLGTQENALRSPVSRYLEWTIHLPQRLFIWDHALTFMLYLGALAYGLLRNNKRLMGYVAIITINVSVLALIGISNDFRYLYVLAFGIFFLPCILLLENRDTLR